MAEITQETVTTHSSNLSQRRSTSITVTNLVYFGFGILEIMLVFRLLLKLMGANAGSFFVRSVYGITSIFVLPFEGIFQRIFTQGIAQTSIFEPSTVAAIIVYAAIAWGIVKFVQILSGAQEQSE